MAEPPAVELALDDGAVRGLREHLESRLDEMVDFIAELARMESPTRDPAAQEPVQSAVVGRLEAMGWRGRVLPGEETGGHLWARPRKATDGAPFQLLIGHSDTVWPRGTLDSMPVEVDREEGVLRGPGVFDMKGGVAQTVFALEALDALGLAPPVTPTVFMNSDEEAGSPESHGHVVRLARHASRAVVLEPALGPAGRIKTARRGNGHFRITVLGQEAHSGLDPGKGASAILEMSHVIQALHGLSDPERGITVNVGEVEGGTRPNVVAGRAEAVVDARVLTTEDGRLLGDRIRAIEPTVPGTRLEVVGGVDIPPMERTPRNRALWLAVHHCGRRLGVELEEGTSGGGSDGNRTSPHCATIDGMGAVGDGAHAAHEHLRIDRLVERTALLALTIMLPELDTNS